MVKFALILSTLLLGSIVSTTTWECYRCKQQYVGNSPPAFAKCPSTNNKQNHWWMRKH